MTPRMHASHARIQDSFDIIRQEMETTTVELEKLRAQRDDYESQGKLSFRMLEYEHKRNYARHASYLRKMTLLETCGQRIFTVNTQVHELGILRRSFYDLETQHVQLRKQYEEEVHRLRSEISRFRGTRPVSRSGSLLNAAPNSNIPSDSRDIGRDRVEREQRIQMPPLFGRVMEPERDMDRLTDHRNAKRLKSRPDQTEDSPIRMESPSKQLTINAMGPPGLMTSTSPKSAVPPPSDCPTGIGPNQFQEAQSNDGNWSVVHNPKVPKVLDVSLLHTFTHGRYVILYINLSLESYSRNTRSCLLISVSIPN